MEELIAIYKMDEIKVETRIKLLIKIGELINFKYASNVTEPLIIELIMLLDENFNFSKYANLQMFIDMEKNNGRA
jgi:hypothetical protein